MIHAIARLQIMKRAQRSLAYGEIFFTPETDIDIAVRVKATM
jgi:hypothetical protein